MQLPLITADTRLGMRDLSMVIVTGAALIMPQAAARAAGSTTLDVPGLGSMDANVKNLSCNGGAGSFSATVDDNKSTTALASSAARGDGYATMTITETAADGTKVTTDLTRTLVANVQQNIAGAKTPQMTIDVKYTSCKTTETTPAKKKM
jgi:hypothetical protein